jgi:hypothetical protein
MTSFFATSLPAIRLQEGGRRAGGNGLSYVELARALKRTGKPSGALLKILMNLERSELIDRKPSFLNRSLVQFRAYLGSQKHHIGSHIV